MLRSFAPPDSSTALGAGFPRVSVPTWLFQAHPRTRELCAGMGSGGPALHRPVLLCLRLGFRHAGTVLEVVLKNFGSQLGTRRCTLLAFHGADDFTAADDFGRAESGDLGRQDQVDFELNVGLQDFLGFEEKSRATDVGR